MRTDDLIRAMSADATPARAFEQVLPLALITSLAVGAPFFLATMGVRPGWFSAMTTLPVLLKQLFPLVMAGAALGAVARLARPDAKLGRWGGALLAAPAIVVASFVAVAVRTPFADWPAAVMGKTTWNCFLSISIIGLLTLACTLAALRRGATVRPRLSGALAGLLGGSVSAALFASFCTDDNPMFWGVWYVGAIASVSAVGAWLGPRQLRW